MSRGQRPRQKPRAADPPVPRQVNLASREPSALPISPGAAGGLPASAQVGAATPWPRLILGLLVVAAVVTAAHWPALTAKTFCFDDFEYLRDNILVRNPSWHSAERLLAEVTVPSTVRGYYQPLAMISLMLDYAAGGRMDQPLPFHRTSLILHVINTLLVVLVLYRLFGSVPIAVAVGLIFGVHPLTVEPIPWIGERKTLLAALFALASLLAYVSYVRGQSRGRWWNYGLCLVLYLLALMSKPTSTPLPLAMLLLDYWPLRRLDRRAVLEKIPLFLLAAVFAVITVVSQGRTAGVVSPQEQTIGRVLLILGHDISFYLFKLIAPIHLSAHYPFPQPFNLSNLRLLIAVAGSVVVIVVLLISWRRTRAVVAGWAVFFVMILPTLGIIGFTNVIGADKFAYLPSIGIWLILAWLLSRWWPKAGKLRPAVVLIVTAVIFAEFAVTRHYLSYWQDSLTYHRRMLELAPRAPFVHNAMGLVLVDRGQYRQALEHYDQAIALRHQQHQRDYWEPHNNMGLALIKLGRFDEAIAAFERAREIYPASAMVWDNLGTAHTYARQYEQAIECHRDALKRNPEYVSAMNNLGAALFAWGRNDEAIEWLNRAIEQFPRHTQAYVNLAQAQHRAGRVEQALATLRRALRIDPDYAQARDLLARMEAYEAAKAAAPADGDTRSGGS